MTIRWHHIWNVSLPLYHYLMIYLIISCGPSVVVHLLSHVWQFGSPMDTEHQAPLSFTVCQSFLKFRSIELVMLTIYLFSTTWAFKLVSLLSFLPTLHQHLPLSLFHTVGAINLKIHLLRYNVYFNTLYYIYYMCVKLLYSKMHGY